MYVLNIFEQLKFGRIHALCEDLRETLDNTDDNDTRLSYVLMEQNKTLDYYDKERTGQIGHDPKKLAKRLHKRISDFRLKFLPIGPDQRDLNDALRNIQLELTDYLSKQE